MATICPAASNAVWATVIALLVAAIPLQVRAQDCGAARTQTAMNECANDSYVRADAALDAASAKVTSRLLGDPAKTQRLVAAQRAWIAFRNGECAFEASATEGGSIHPFIVTQCLESLTRRRTEELGVFLRCQDGDLGCPVPSR